MSFSASQIQTRWWVLKSYLENVALCRREKANTVRDRGFVMVEKHL